MSTTLNPKSLARQVKAQSRIIQNVELLSCSSTTVLIWRFRIDSRTKGFVPVNRPEAKATKLVSRHCVRAIS